MTDQTPPPLPYPPREPVIDVEAIPALAEDTSGPTIEVPPPPPPQAPQEPPVLSSAPPPRPPWRAHLWAAICHLLLFLVIPTVFLGAVITFFVWQVFGKRDAQVEDQGREALNFQINVAAVTAILGATCLWTPLVPLVWLVALIFCMLAARAASKGESYRYPWVLRVVTH
ncbi:MAG: DUF4870 domain-containing protein [Planctomycetota bacterium]